MSSELFKKCLEFNETLDAAKNAKKNVLRAAENVLRTAYEQNGNKPVSFESTCLDNCDEDFVGEYDTLSFEDGDLCLSHSECEEVESPELDCICYRDLETLVKAVVDAVD